jgi:hypothetical protein
MTTHIYTVMNSKFPPRPGTRAMGNHLGDQASQGVLEYELEPFFELGGPAYRLMQRIGIIKGIGPSIGRRIVAFIAVTWLPLLVFASLEGYAIGPTPRTSFLLDFATYTRFFIAVPLIFAAEIVVGPRMRAAGLQFIQSGIIQPADRPAFLAAAARARRRRDAILPEVLFLAAAFVGAWFLTIERLGGLGTATWHTLRVSGELRLMPAGLWYNFVAVPLVQRAGSGNLHSVLSGFSARHRRA